MQLKTSYNQILSISTPIMLGSAVQNIIALTDGVFLSRLSNADFATIAIVGIYYLVVAAIGFGFSKGGQIIIARRIGEENYGEVGRTFYAMLYFELAMALVLFLFMQFGSYYFFSLFLEKDIIFVKCLEYLDYRSWGVFFSYAGVAIVALYTGIARTTFIIVDTLILALVNIILNYGLIFGKWGLPEMGIGGAGLASTIAEVVAFVIFLIYIFRDERVRKFRMFHLPEIDFELIRQQLKIAMPIVAQAVVGLGSWFVFIVIIKEHLGEDALVITNLVRMVYLCLSIPCWGFASGINTLVSNYIGSGQREEVMPVIFKTAKLCLITTMLMAIPVALFPEALLTPMFGATKLPFIIEARPILYILLGILSVFSVGGVYFNGLVGTGATYYGLKMQTVCAVFYLLYIYIVVVFTDGGLTWAWASEIFYWIAMLVFTLVYLRTNRWHRLQV